MRRRDALKVLLAAPVATLAWTDAEAAQAAASAQAARVATAKPFVPKFFTATEFKLVSVLADIIIPKDERSGSATDAGVPEFMDFILNDQADMQDPMRGGLAWLDNECRDRFGKAFVDCSDAQRAAVLDDIAWPAKARPELSNGVEFFNRMRDLTASGFFSSKMGVEDLKYLGNTVVAEWNGCPPAALARLGVQY
jgi:Gluconate 2-dehydrogenase subunit 3